MCGDRSSAIAIAAYLEIRRKSRFAFFLTDFIVKTPVAGKKLWWRRGRVRMVCVRTSEYQHEAIVRVWVGVMETMNTTAKDWTGFRRARECARFRFHLQRIFPHRDVVRISPPDLQAPETVRPFCFQSHCRFTGAQPLKRVQSMSRMKITESGGRGDAVRTLEC